MTAFNVVRFRVKAGHEKEFLDQHMAMNQSMKGWRKGQLIKTGDRSYCLIGEWDKFDSIVAPRPQMVKILDGMRGILEDLGGGLGFTDPVSGDVVLDLKP